MWMVWAVKEVTNLLSYGFPILAKWKWWLAYNFGLPWMFGGPRNLPEPLELCTECLNTTKNFLRFPLLHSLVIPKKTVISICSCPPSYTLNFLFCTGVLPVSSVVIVLGEQWRDSVIHIHGSILLSTPLPSRLPHHSRQSSMCDTVGPWWLSILKKQCVQDHPKLPNCPFPAATIRLLVKSVLLFLFYKLFHLCHFLLDSTRKGCHVAFLLSYVLPSRIRPSQWSVCFHVNTAG